MTYIFDFFGVISSEVAPPWFKQHLPGIDIKKIRKDHVEDVDLGNTSLEAFYTTLSTLSKQEPSTIKEQWDDLVVIDRDVVSVIEKLHEHTKIGLCSNAPADLIRPILETHNLERLFNVIVISGEVGMIKPNEDIFLYTLKHLEATPSATTFVDDSEQNIVAAQKLGMHTIHYGGFSDIENLID